LPYKENRCNGDTTSQEEEGIASLTGAATPPIAFRHQYRRKRFSFQCGKRVVEALRPSLAVSPLTDLQWNTLDVPLAMTAAAVIRLCYAPARNHLFRAHKQIVLTPWTRRLTHGQ
jgi:hypothetical protein